MLRTVAVLAAILTSLMFPVSASAFWVTLDFTAHGYDDGLVGSGSFTFDSSLIPPEEDWIVGQYTYVGFSADQARDLTFEYDGHNFDMTDAVVNLTFWVTQAGLGYDGLHQAAEWAGWTIRRDGLSILGTDGMGDFRFENEDGTWTAGAIPLGWTITTSLPEPPIVPLFALGLVLSIGFALSGAPKPHPSAW